MFEDKFPTMSFEYLQQFIHLFIQQPVIKFLLYSITISRLLAFGDKPKKDPILPELAFQWLAQAMNKH